MKNELNIDELDAVTGGALSDAYSYAVAGAGLKMVANSVSYAVFAMNSPPAGRGDCGGAPKNGQHG